MISQILTWQTALDILVIATGFFFVYRTLIGLGTWKIVSGILIALTVFFAASLLDLKGVEWIYRNLSHVFVISLVVLFQPELRKCFEKAASSMHRRHRSKEQYASLVAQSLWRLAGEKVGALILKRGKFTSFGVRIPVSQSGQLSNHFGTRHQAAMGLSEKTDALVVAVSEERGQVSVFKRGKMTVMDSEDQIDRAIADHSREAGLFEAAGRDKTAMKTLVLESSCSLAAALAFWVILISGHGQMIEKVITVAVEYTAVADNLVMTGEKATQVKLHLSGSRTDLDLVSLANTRVTIDLAKVTAGKQTVVINDGLMWRCV